MLRCDPHGVVGRGGVSFCVLQYSFMVVWHVLLLGGTVWMLDFAWKNCLEYGHEQAYDYDNRGQVCFRLYCPWVGLSCLAVFLWPPFDALPAGSALGSGAVAADQGTVKRKSRLGERPKQLVLYRRSTHMVNPTISKFPDLIWDWDVQMVSTCINCSDGHRDPVPQWPIICLVIAILEYWKDWSRSSNTFMVQERRDW